MLFAHLNTTNSMAISLEMNRLNCCRLEFEALLSRTAWENSDKFSESAI